MRRVIIISPAFINIKTVSYLLTEHLDLSFARLQ